MSMTFHAHIAGYAAIVILKDELVYKTGDSGTELYFIVEGGINLILKILREE